MNPSSERTEAAAPSTATSEQQGYRERSDQATNRMTARFYTGDSTGVKKRTLPQLLSMCWNGARHATEGRFFAPRTTSRFSSIRPPTIPADSHMLLTLQYDRERKPAADLVVKALQGRPTNGWLCTDKRCHRPNKDMEITLRAGMGESAWFKRTQLSCIHRSSG